MPILRCHSLGPPGKSHDRSILIPVCAHTATHGFIPVSTRMGLYYWHVGPCWGIWVPKGAQRMHPGRNLGSYAGPDVPIQVHMGPIWASTGHNMGLDGPTRAPCVPNTNDSASFYPDNFNNARQWMEHVNIVYFLKRKKQIPTRIQHPCSLHCRY